MNPSSRYRTNENKGNNEKIRRKKAFNKLAIGWVLKRNRNEEIIIKKKLALLGINLTRLENKGRENNTQENIG